MDINDKDNKNIGNIPLGVGGINSKNLPANTGKVVSSIPNAILSLSNKAIKYVNKRIKKGGKTFSKLFIWLYALLFILSGFFFLTTLVIEYVSSKILDYKNLFEFIQTYYGIAVSATAVTIALLLIDKDGDGISDDLKIELNNKKTKGTSTLPINSNGNTNTNIYVNPNANNKGIINNTNNNTNLHPDFGSNLKKNIPISKEINKKQ